MTKPQTPSQTIGPYFAYGLTAEQYGYPFTQVITAKNANKTNKIVIEGQVFDGKGVAIPDVMIELWHPDIGLLRLGTGSNPDSIFRFETSKPAAKKGQAPHFAVAIFMRGLLSHVFTRLYFGDEVVANAQDEVLAQIPSELRATIIAQAAQGNIYRFNIHMQGEHETVFIDT